MLEIAKSPDDVIDNEDYYIRDFMIRDDDDNIIATVCETTLKPGKKTRGHIDKHNEAYFFMNGVGTMIIDRDLVEVGSGVGRTQTVFVKKGQFHRVANFDALLPLSFLSVVPGEVNRVPYPDPGHRLD